ncbi:hypothetical protein WJX74_006924 [Apatococcus lobatus]|uniref:Eukaryotic translation initiation factor 4B n=1 Tax=Apatococcus lobatus TaxID=904363 RepID=A0AAW1RH73_9CHLO
MSAEPVANVWGVAPAPASKSDWADSVDQDEAANGGQLPELPSLGSAPMGGESAFPSLGEAAKPAAKKKGRNRGQTLALSEFQAGPAAAAPSRPVFRSSSAAASRDRSADIKLQLPKGPRERDENEESSDALGGGFKDYSGAKARGPRRRDDEEDDGPRRMEDLGPSKADESDDWGADRKPGGAFGGGGGFADRDRPARTSGFGGDSAAADSAASWGSSRPSAASTAPPRRAGGSFGGFDRDDGSTAPTGFVPSDKPPRRAGGGFDAAAGGSGGADEESRWGSKFTPGEPRRAPSSSGADDGSSWASRRAPSPAEDAPAAAAAPTSRPRLNLKPRSAPAPGPTSQDEESSQQGGSSVKSGDDSEADAPAPAPAAPSAPRSNPFGQAKPRDEKLVAPAKAEETGNAEAVAAPAPAAAPAARSNPFGAARPREEVLRQQGRHASDEAAPRPETPEEAELREKIEGLKLRVKEGEGEAEIQVPALSSSGSAQPNGFPQPTTPPTEAVSGGEAVDMAKKTIEQASGGNAESTSDSTPESSSAHPAPTSNEGPSEGSAAAVVAGGSPPKPANAWAKKPSLQLQTTVQQHLQDCEGKLKQLSIRLDTEARQASQPASAAADPTAASAKPAPSRW